jgi:hypothetical protein
MCVNRGGQLGVFKLGCSSLGVSIFRWSKPPHHVKVNTLRGGVSLPSFIVLLSFMAQKNLEDNNLHITITGP